MDSHGKTVMVFGVFDLFHDGHRHFLRNAASLGNHLVVAVAPDAIVSLLKGAAPKDSLETRVKNIKHEVLTASVISGDETLGNWEIIKKYNPDTVALGYDQKNVASALRDFFSKNDISPELVFVEPYADGTLHSRNLKESRI